MKKRKIIYVGTDIYVNIYLIILNNFVKNFQNKKSESLLDNADYLSDEFDFKNENKEQLTAENTDNKLNIFNEYDNLQHKIDAKNVSEPNEKHLKDKTNSSSNSKLGMSLKRVFSTKIAVSFSPILFNVKYFLELNIIQFCLVRRAK